MICKFIDKKINKMRNNTNRSSSHSHSPIASVHQLQSPNHQLRPYYTSSPKYPPTPLLLQYPMTMPRLHTSIPSHIITKKEIEYNLEESLKKSTTKNYIRDILDEDMELSNQILIAIIVDYNRYTNTITDPDYFVCRANEILLEYTNINEFNSDNLYQAYNFIILANIVSFWIFYKFMIDDKKINTKYLQYYLNLNNVILDTDVILNIEIDILKTIDYNLLRFI